MIIGITGAIGSGKTTVSGIFKRYGFAVIDADEIGHEIIKKSPIKKVLVKNFGKKILDNKKNIDRKRLGDVVFANKTKLKKLNSITHPAIKEGIKKEISKFKKQGRNIAVDSPLLYESGMQKMFDKVIVVAADEKIIFRRLGKKYTKEKIRNILKNQIPINVKIKMADFVVENNGNLKSLESQVKGVISKLKQ